MRIHSQEQIAFSANRAKRNANQIEKSIQKLASGLKIAKGSDNAAGLAISETMRAQVRGLSQAQRNMQDGLSVLEASNEGLNNVNGLLQRARELAVLSANGTLTEQDRLASEKELTQLMGAIDDTAERLEFNTMKILGDNAPLILQVGANPTQQIKVDLVDVGTAALGIQDASLLTQSDAEELISRMDNAIQIVSGHLTRIGSDMEAIEHHLQNAMLFETNLTKSLSMLEDTDIAKEMMTFINHDIRQKGDHLLVQHVNRNLNETLGIFNR
ncbi:flagellin [Sporosarcina soli]|uniref:Flagellin n=1 Tax=Sporosarcina soli TaxID=334736 RepID=A0ABW0TJZ2_9BACL